MVITSPSGSPISGFDLLGFPLTEFKEKSSYLRQMGFERPNRFEDGNLNAAHSMTNLWARGFPFRRTTRAIRAGATEATARGDDATVWMAITAREDESSRKVITSRVHGENTSDGC